MSQGNPTEQSSSSSLFPSTFSSSNASFSSSSQTTMPSIASSQLDDMKQSSPVLEAKVQRGEAKSKQGRSHQRWVLHSAPLSRALFAALQTGDIDTAKNLITRGAPLNVKNERGETPLLVATRNGYLQIVNILLKAEQGLASVDIV